MGGKNKKPRGDSAPTAHMTAAATARARSTGAQGPDEPSSRIRQGQAAPAREPRGKQGQKTYSFASPADSKSAANRDKSILKVVIDSNLEQRIISLINEHRNQINDKGSVSGRLTAKKLQDLYMALQGFSFKAADIEDAMKNTVLYGGDLHSALDWLCLNLPDDALPDGFSQQLGEEEKRNRAKFEPPPQPPVQLTSPRIAKTKKEKEVPEKKPSQGAAEKETTRDEKEGAVEKEDGVVKDWILRYVEQEQESDEEKQQSAEVSEEERFDPNKNILASEVTKN